MSHTVISSFLREVAAEAATNKMDAQNLATVFAPTLMRPRDDGDAGPAQVCYTDLPWIVPFYDNESKQNNKFYFVIFMLI